MSLRKASRGSGVAGMGSAGTHQFIINFVDQMLLTQDRIGISMKQFQMVINGHLEMKYILLCDSKGP